MESSVFLPSDFASVFFVIASPLHFFVPGGVVSLDPLPRAIEQLVEWRERLEPPEPRRRTAIGAPRAVERQLPALHRRLRRLQGLPAAGQEVAALRALALGLEQELLVDELLLRVLELLRLPAVPEQEVLRRRPQQHEVLQVKAGGVARYVER